MNSLDNKAFKNLISQAAFEMNYINEVQILSSLNEEFKFTYDLSKDAITERGEIVLTGEQEKQLCELAFNHYQDNAPETTDAELSPDYYSMYGVNRQMFI